MEVDRHDFEEAQRLIREGDTEGLAAFASRDVERRAEEAARRAAETNPGRCRGCGCSALNACTRPVDLEGADGMVDETLETCGWREEPLPGRPGLCTACGPGLGERQPGWSPPINGGEWPGQGTWSMAVPSQIARPATEHLQDGATLEHHGDGTATFTAPGLSYPGLPPELDSTEPTVLEMRRWYDRIQRRRRRRELAVDLAANAPMALIGIAVAAVCVATAEDAIRLGLAGAAAAGLLCAAGGLAIAFFFGLDIARALRR